MLPHRRPARSDSQATLSGHPTESLGCLKRAQCRRTCLSLEHAIFLWPRRSLHDSMQCHLVQSYLIPVMRVTTCRARHIVFVT